MAYQLRQILGLAESLPTLQDERQFLHAATSLAVTTFGSEAAVLLVKSPEGRYEAVAWAGQASGDPGLRDLALDEDVLKDVAPYAPTTRSVSALKSASRKSLRADSAKPDSVDRSQPSGLTATTFWDMSLVDSRHRVFGHLLVALDSTQSRPGFQDELMLEALGTITSVGRELLSVRAIEQAAAAAIDAQRQQLESLIAASARVRGEVAEDAVLTGLARTITRSGGFRCVRVCTVTAGRLRQVASIGHSPADDAQFKQSAWELADLVRLMKAGARISRSYVLEEWRLGRDVTGDRESAVASAASPAPVRWLPSSLLGIPIVDQAGVLVGLVLLEQPLDGLGPELSQVQALEFLVDQSCVALDAARQVAAADIAANTDPLTGLPNRRALVEYVERAIDRLRVHGEHSALLFIDIDHFKDVNDRFGHAAGDTVLRRVSEVLATRLRKHDSLARYGGEEFVVLLRETKVSEAMRIAESLRARVESTAWPEVAGLDQVHVSVGVAAVSEVMKTSEEALEVADTALYVAKGSGRNRVTLAQQSPAAEPADNREQGPN
jgi:diguanylate cyclase (GGDEF)-like protein